MTRTILNEIEQECFDNMPLSEAIELYCKFKVAHEIEDGRVKTLAIE